MKQNKTAFGIALASVLGSAISFIIAITALGTVSYMIVNGKIPYENGAYFGWAIHVVSIFVGCVISGLLSRNYWIASVGTAALNIFIYICVVILAFDGQFANVLITILLNACGCVAAILMQSRRKKGYNKLLKKYTHR